MKQIDWNKAPDLATHGAFAGVRGNICWYIVCGETYQFLYADEMKQGREWSELKFGSPCHGSLIQRPTAPQWNGEGLPPVGLVCEVDNPHEPGEWHECTIPVHDGDIAVFGCCNGYPYVYDGQSADSFRPARTAEQIVAEERIVAIKEMVESLGCDTDSSRTREFILCGIIYDAGYRKPNA